MVGLKDPSHVVESPSARRAWVEIFLLLYSVHIALVSPSARRAWVEIDSIRSVAGMRIVALREEGVG